MIAQVISVMSLPQLPLTLLVLNEGVVYNECTGAGEAPPHPQSVHFSNQILKYGWCSTTSQWEGKWGACGGNIPTTMASLEYP